MRKRWERLPGGVDEGVRVLPVRQQVCGLHVIHTDVHVGEGFWEEVVDLPRHVQDVAHTVMP